MGGITPGPSVCIYNAVCLSFHPYIYTIHAWTRCAQALCCSLYALFGSLASPRTLPITIQPRGKVQGANLLSTRTLPTTLTLMPSESQWCFCHDPRCSKDSVLLALIPSKPLAIGPKQQMRDPKHDIGTQVTTKNATTIWQHVMNKIVKTIGPWHIHWSSLCDVAVASRIDAFSWPLLGGRCLGAVAS